MKKKSRSYLLTELVLEAIDKAFNSDMNKVKGESKNVIVTNCILYGLKELYKIEV